MLLYPRLHHPFPIIKASARTYSTNSVHLSNNMSVYDLKVIDIDGNPFDLGQFRGKVTLLVNVASKCGYTGQYTGLQELQEKYQGQGFSVIGFPCNGFLWQEPHACPIIKEFASKEYHITFPLTDKIEVNGAKQSPVFALLQANMPGKVKWNFEKFLVNKNGILKSRFATKVQPKELEKYIEELLKEEI